MERLLRKRPLTALMIASQIVLGSLGSESLAELYFHEENVVEEALKSLEFLNGNAPACGDQAVTFQPLSCSHLSALQATRRCVGSRQDFPPKRIRKYYFYSCFKIFGVPLYPFILEADYVLSVKNGLPEIRQYINFRGTLTRKQENTFQTLLDSALPRIKKFFERQGIVYHLEYTINAAPEHVLAGPVIKLSMGYGRSNSNFWMVRQYLEGEEREGGFPSVTAHELLHRMGLPDDYEDESIKWCPVQYGSHGRNKERPRWIPRSNISPKYPMDSTSSNIMHSQGSIEDEEIPADYVLRLLAPLCPNLCSK